MEYYIMHMKRINKNMGFENEGNLITIIYLITQQLLKGFDKICEMDV